MGLGYLHTPSRFSPYWSWVTAAGRPPSAWCPFSGEPEPRRQAGEGRRRCPLLLTLAAGSIRVHPGLSGLSVPRVESAPCPFLNPSSLTFLIF